LKRVEEVEGVEGVSTLHFFPANTFERPVIPSVSEESFSISSNYYGVISSVSEEFSSTPFNPF